MGAINEMFDYGLEVHKKIKGELTKKLSFDL